MTKLNIEEIEAKITNLYKQLGEYSQAIIKLLSELEILKAVKAGKPEAREQAYAIYKKDDSVENKKLWMEAFESETAIMAEINLKQNQLATFKFKQKNIASEIGKYEAMLDNYQKS